MNHNQYKKNSDNVFFVSLSVLCLSFSASALADTNKLNYRIVDQTPSYSNAQSSRFGQNSTSSSGLNLNMDNQSSNPNSYRPPFPQQGYPSRPPMNQPHHPNGNYPNQRPYPVYPQQNGLTIIYNQQFPTQTEYRSESYGFVNGDSHSSIESSKYTLISDWRRYHLPAPSAGMHWIYQDGRYLQMPNKR